MQRNPTLIPPAAFVDVWLAPPSAQACFDASALTQAEQRKWSGLHSARRRRDFEVSRALCLAVAPEAVPTRSLSHSHGYAVVATVEQGTVGVDIEKCSPRDGARLATAAFAADEARYVATRSTEAERTLAFYDVWVLKEACAKALGVSLLDVLQRTNFGASLAEGSAARGEALEGLDYSAWIFAPHPELRVAVFCVGAGPTREPRVHSWPDNTSTSWSVRHRLAHARVAQQSAPA